MSASDIYNYRKVSDLLATAGQPTEDQLRSAAAEGFKIIINLATINPRYSLPDEEGLVRSLGMAYHHIPVDWQNPRESDVVAFEQLMQSLPQEKTLIHCAANFRVTAFYSLYARKRLGWTATQADQFRASIWAGSDYPVWEDFIGRIEAELTRTEQACRSKCHEVCP
jgi:protein tyrosine phosphatase (PTP) superfamily phosphohydrolase (DUF442 family)